MHRYFTKILEEKRDDREEEDPEELAPGLREIAMPDPIVAVATDDFAQYYLFKVLNI